MRLCHLVHLDQVDQLGPVGRSSPVAGRRVVTAVAGPAVRAALAARVGPVVIRTALLVVREALVVRAALAAPLGMMAIWPQVPTSQATQWVAIPTMRPRVILEVLGSRVVRVARACRRPIPRIGLPVL